MIFTRALYGLYVAMAICSVEELDRCKEVCTSVFKTSLEILKLYGIECVIDKHHSDRFLQELAKLKVDQGPYRSFYFDFDGANMRVDWSGFDRSVDVEQALTPIFHRLLAIWKKRLQNPVLALIAHGVWNYRAYEGLNGL